MSSINNRKMYFNDEMQLKLDEELAKKAINEDGTYIGYELLRKGRIYIGYGKDKDEAELLSPVIVLQIDENNNKYFIEADDNFLNAECASLVINDKKTGMYFNPKNSINRDIMVDVDDIDKLINEHKTFFGVPKLPEMNNNNNNVNNINKINNINNIHQSMHNYHQNSQANNINFGNNNIFNQDDSDDEDLRAVLEKSKLEYEAEKTAMEKYKDDYLNDNGEATTEKGQEAIDKAKDEDLPFGYYVSGDHHRHIQYQTKVYKPGKGGGKGSGE